MPDAGSNQDTLNPDILQAILRKAASIGPVTGPMTPLPLAPNRQQDQLSNLVDLTGLTGQGALANVGPAMPGAAELPAALDTLKGAIPNMAEAIFNRAMRAGGRYGADVATPTPLPAAKDMLSKDVLIKLMQNRAKP